MDLRHLVSQGIVVQTFLWALLRTLLTEVCITYMLCYARISLSIALSKRIIADVILLIVDESVGAVSTRVAARV